MKITHRAPADASAPSSVATELLALAPSLDKAPRLSCCCRLSELLPKVREVHDAMRAARLVAEAAPAEAA
ncbi:MAG: hypothetical protein EOO62_35340 [Hymenobacter sp.]|nr:MAG: hypothetical protein EOO62_35340 [Hymenobacter sp.]